MRLVVLTYRLTKIKGVLVSVGICALTRATMFMGSAVGAAGLALAWSVAARAVPPTPGCNAGNGTIATSTTGTAYLWTAPTNCTVTAGTIAMSNSDALTASNAGLTHGSLTNIGWLHASLTGTVLSGATISGFSNLVNVGSIDNTLGATIQGDYLAGTLGGTTLSPDFRPFRASATGLSGTGNAFAIYGVNNQLGATIGTLSNEGAILGTVVSGIGPNTVSEGVIVGLNNDGVITGTLSNSGRISASFNTGAGVSGTSNVLSSVGIANSNHIGALTNSGFISGDSAILNGTLDLVNGSFMLGGSSATIGQLGNTGTLSGNYAGILDAGRIDTITNSALIQGGYDGIVMGPNSSVGSIDNQSMGLISANVTGIANLGGSIGSLHNSATITGGAVGLLNQGTIGTFSSSSGAALSATNAGNATALHNTGYIGAVTNAGSISGPGGVVNSGTIVSFGNTASGSVAASAGDAISNVGGSIGTLSNAGVIQTTNTGGNGGGFNALYNDSNGTIGLITNGGSIISSATSTMIGNLNETALVNLGAIGTLTNSGRISGTIIGAGLNNQGSIGLLSNLASGSITGTISGSYGIVNAGGGILQVIANGGLINGTHTGISNSATIGTLTNSGAISGGYFGIQNGGLIATLGNSGSIGGQSAAIFNIVGSIGTLVNEGSIGAANTGLANSGQVSALTNQGGISGANSYGILNYESGSIGSVTNTRTITGGSTGIRTYGVITALVNSGSIAGVGKDGIVNTGGEGGPASIDAITNSGVISGHSAGVYNDGTIGSLSNTGLITGGEYGVYNDSAIGTLSVQNSGVIRGAAYAIANSGTIAALVNAATIVGTGGAGIWNPGTLDSLTNTGHITGVTGGVLNVHGSIGTLTNSGTIEGTGSLADGVYNSGSIDSLTNSGLIHGTGSGVYNHAVAEPTLLPETPPSAPAPVIESLSNSITGTISGAATGLYNAGRLGTVSNAGLISGAVGLADTGGSIGSLDNSGTIIGTQGNGVYADGSIGTLTNEGKITGALNALDIDVSGTLATLANSGLLAAPTAINVAARGSLGPITDSGKVAGNIVNASTGDLSIAGGSGTVFGTLTGFSGGLGVGDIGQITNTASNVAFTAGNLLLNDHINVGTGKVTNAATLEVDNLIDIKGGYLQTSAGTLSVGVAGVSTHGELDVSSAATVQSGGHVALTPLDGFRFAAGESFTLIEAASATYNVAAITASAAGFNGGYLISEVQSGGQTDLVVCLTNDVAPNCSGKKPAYSLATTSNAISASNAVGSYTGSNAALTRLANAVLSLGTSPAANRAGNQLLADPHNNGAGLAMQPSLDVLNVVTGHSDSTRLAANGGESGVAAGESGPGFAAWGEAYGGGSHQSENGQFSGFSMSSEGLVAGGDAVIADSDTRVGAVFTYTHADLHDHGDRTGDSLSLDSDGVLVYASFLGARAYADLLGGVLFDRFDTVRVVDITGFNGVASGSHDGTQYVAKAAGGYRLPVGGASGTTLTPIWGLTYSHLNQDAYTESGGNGAALRVDGEGDNSLKGEVGLKLERSFAVARGDVVPEVRLMYRHEFDNGAQLQTASFAADAAGTTFSTLNARPIENSGLGSVGVNLLGNDGVTVTLKYTAEIATGYVSQGGSLRVRWVF